MKKSFLMLALFSVVCFSYSCRDTEKEPDTVVIEKESDPEVIVKEDDDKGLLEQAGEQIDNEVNEEVSEEIDKIGDDK
ncbi:MAG TPA: hypothetical protein VFM82_01845 [Flavobacteriaceae bacterium]|nr:hypothetical protein [Flavobacteriaceae bacterium]